jgi:hypothetical protein
MVTIPEDVKKRELEVRSFIEAHSELFEIDPNIVRAIITQESRFVSNATSPTGAFGYGQFTNIGAKQVQNIALMTPKATDLKNFTKQDADDNDPGIKAICATLWWLYYKKYGTVEDKKVRLEACLTFYNSGGKAANLVVQYGGHSEALPAIKQLNPNYRAQAVTYAPQVSLWFLAWHDLLQAEKVPAPVEVVPAPTPVNPFDTKVAAPVGQYKALVEALRLLGTVEGVDFLTHFQNGQTEVTLILPGEY